MAPVGVPLPLANERADDATPTVQSDLVIVSDRGKNQRNFVRGAPAFTAEMLSPGNASHDHVHKRRRYEQAGEREFWLVDPVEELLRVYVLQDGKFGPVAGAALTGSRALGILPDLAVDFDAIAAAFEPTR